MMRRHELVCLSVVLILSCIVYSASAQPQVRTGINGSAGQAIERFRIELGPSAPGGNWAMQVQVGSRIEEIRDDSVENVFLPGRSFELPMRPGETARIVSVSGDAPQIVRQEIRRSLLDRSYLFSIGPDKPRYLPPPTGPVRTSPAADAFIQLMRRADAVISVFYVHATTGKEHHCVAFQYQPGLFMTNDHCSRGRNPRAVFGNLTDPSTAPYRAITFIASGATHPDLGKLDAAVFRIAGEVPEEFKTALLELDDGAASPDMPLELHQRFANTAAMTPGRAVSDSKYCVVKKPIPGMCAAADFLHGCTTDSGSSGSPVLRRGTNKVIGLHHAGLLGAANCAVGAGQIKQVVAVSVRN